MENTGFLKEYAEIYDSLSDDISKTTYEAAILRLLEGRDRFYNKLIENGVTIPCRFDDLSFFDFFRTHEKKVVMFGAGENAKPVYYTLRLLGYDVEGIYDNDPGKWGKNVGDLKVSPAHNLLEQENKKDTFVVISAIRSKLEINFELCQAGFPRENIFATHGLPFTKSVFIDIHYETKEYFDDDIFNPTDDEIFIDGGALNCWTSLQFRRWVKGKYRKIYAFEPSPTSISFCKDIIKKYNLTNIHLIEKGLWSTDSTMSFNNFEVDLAASQLKPDGNGNITVPVTSLDNVLKGDPATFIKMDVEGAELQALIGARETILRYRPKLAICIYHKPQDLIEIPTYIKSLIPDYKLYIRHYSDRHYFGSILYAI